MPSERAPAKVNLFLHVVGRRADGYHLLDSLAVFPGAADVLHAEPAPALTLRVDGPFGAGLAAEPDNLVLRAARALAGSAGQALGAAMVLEKHLPVASGIGGGSADAAAALRLLDRIWRLGTPPATLNALALGLGADVPVCLAAAPARMGGVGDVLGIAPSLPRCGMVLVNPGQAVPTPAVFRARDAGFSDAATLPQRWADAPTLAADLAELRNDLQAPAITLCPTIADVLAWIAERPGCLLARMSGSGATCYGLFADPAAARQAASAAPSPWWAWGGPLSHPGDDHAP